ncbi:MAG TPA: hypothetical protein VKS79_10990 [Gemmataceae bacterium]|nr:hypothetical protein [Gemmataceae bacterium]
MRLTRLAALVLIPLLVSSLSAQAPPTQDLPAAPRAPSLSHAQPVEVRFTDDSVMKLTLLHDSLEFTTRYGKLTVPAGEIRKIELGLRYPEGVPQRIEAAMAQLADKDYRKREAASAELLRLQELAYPAVKQAANSKNAEVAARANRILEELERRLPEEHLNVKGHDVIHTAEFTFAGRLELATLKAHSPYLGSVDVKLTDARVIRFLSGSNEATLTIDAAKFGAGTGKWLDTGIELSGEMLTVNATGQIDLLSLASEKGVHLTTADGSRPGGRPTHFPSGALIGRLGPNGKEFIIGAKYEAVPPGEGSLMLRIEGSPWRIAPSGSYTVQIAVSR